jgi:hypothetical protein
MFVKLTRVDKLIAYVDMEKVLHMTRHGDNKPFTRLYFSHDHTLQVTETPDEIIDIVSIESLRNA